MKDKDRFLFESLKLIGENLVNAEKVYAFWRINIDKINTSLIQEITDFASKLFELIDEEKQEDSAAIFLAFGNLMQQFDSGDRGVNLELAITSYQIYARVIQQKSPFHWARTQHNLGTVYFVRIEGDHKDNIELAIHTYQAALEVLTRNDFPLEWARTQKNLGLAYRDRIEGDRKVNLEFAIDALQASLEVNTRQAFPDYWADIQCNLGDAYLKRIKGNRNENIELAIDAFRASLEVNTRQVFPDDWAMIQYNLSVAYRGRIEGDRKANLEQAIQSCLASMEVHTRQNCPVQWAEAQNHLGAIYSGRIEGEHEENIKQAIHAFQSALEIYTRQNFPVQWARTQKNLVFAYHDRKVRFLQESLQLIENSQSNAELVYAFWQKNIDQINDSFIQIMPDLASQILVENGIEMRARFATVFRKFGELIYSFPFGNRGFNIELAIHALRASLEVNTRQAFPDDWASTQYSLGISYLNRIVGDRTDNLELAIDALRALLEVITRQASPDFWANIQYNLGDTYLNRIEGERSENIELAIHALRASLEVNTRQAFPDDWANIQYNLGIAYINQIEGDRQENIELAIQAYQDALEVFTLEKSVQWAKTKTNLGDAYRNRIKGDYKENIELAIQAYRDALEVFTQENFPVEWEMVQNNLDNVYRDRQVEFLQESLQIIANNQGETKVYEFWQMNIDKIDVSLIQKIPDVASQILEEESKENRLPIIRTFGEFGHLLVEFPLGDRKINLELAIAIFQVCANFVNLDESPSMWVAIQYSLGSVYLKRIEGDRRENIEQVIQFYWATLEVHTRESFPENWANIQNNLGSTYLDQRIEGDRQENIERAIQFYRAALEVYTRESFPKNWAFTQANLGVAYRHRVAGNRQENIELAIQLCRAVLEVYTHESSPEDWAFTQIVLGDAYCDRIAGDRQENIELAIQAYQDASEVFTQENFPIEWKMVQNNLDDLARGYSYLNDRGEAIGYTFREPLKVSYHRPVEWEIVQNNLDNVYRDRQDNSDNAYLDPQVKVFLLESLRLILNNQGETRVYEYWQMNIDKIDVSLIQIIPDIASQILEAEDKEKREYIGGIFGEFGYLIQEFPLGKRRINVELAITCYRIKVSTFTRMKYPTKWAATQLILGIAYFNRIEGERNDNLEQAIQSFQAALEVYTRYDFPIEWASIQNNLSIVYFNREGDRRENIEQAIHFCQAALEIYTRHEFPIEWAKTQNNLGIACCNQIEGDRKWNLERGIHAYRSSLEICTKQNFPVEWAKTQHNLGNAYCKTIEDKRNENLEQAIQSYQAALEVYTQQSFPNEWASAQKNLGHAYYMRIKGDRKKNLELAMKAYRAALEVQQPELLPVDCLQTGSNLGNLAFQEGDWNTAIEGFEKAITAVEVSRNWATIDRDRQEIVNESIGIYEKMLQSCINANRLDLALQTVERTRSKRLVDLMATSDLYPQGEIPEPVRLILEQIANIQQQMDDLRLGVQSSESELGTRNRAATAPPTAEIQALEAQKQNFLDELSRYDAVSAQLVDINPPDVSQIQAKLVDRLDVAILSFYTTTQDTHILIVRSNSIQCLTCPGQGFQLNSWLINEWLLAYIVDKTSWQQNMPELLKQLAAKLELDRLVTEHLQDVSELILIPHLYLHLIPFAALPLNGNQQYLGDSATQTLGDRFLLRYAPGCQVLKFCTDRTELPPPQQYGTVENATEDLPFAAIEGDAIAQIFQIRDTDRLRGSHQATIEQYKELLGRVNSVVSCHHAQSRLDKPLESALLLANNRRVTLGDLLSPAWRFADLNDVFLSCCETGMNMPKTLTDELLTLGTGFLCAGARNVISSLWSVDDIATALLSQIYHRHRFQGDDRVVSLQKAQQELRSMSGAQVQALSEAEFIPALIAQQEQLEEHRQTALCQKEQADTGSEAFQQWAAEEHRYGELIDRSVQRQIDLEQHWEKTLPFENPFYWAPFTCQGLR